MKKAAAILILFGSGLTAYGVAGFSGEFGTNARGAAFDQPNTLDGSFGWSPTERSEIVTGVVLLASGLLLRKGSN